MADDKKFVEEFRKLEIMAARAARKAAENPDGEEVYIIPERFFLGTPVSILKKFNPDILFPIRVKSKDGEHKDQGFLFKIKEDEVEKVIKFDPFLKGVYHLISERKQKLGVDIDVLLKESDGYIFKICEKLTTVKEKINLLRLLAAEIELDGLSEYNEKTAIFAKDYLLSVANDISKLKSEHEQNVCFENFLKKMFINATGLYTAVKKVLNLGEIKFSNPAVVPVLLKDGTKFNLLEYDFSKELFIEHNINISKIKTPLNLSKVSIDGDFICINVKVPVEFPKCVYGNLVCTGCSDAVLNKNMVIPNGVTNLYCEGVINSFETLLKMKFPNTLKMIVISKNFLNTVKTDNSVFVLAKQFMNKYPNIELVSYSDNLRRIIKDKETVKIKEVVIEKKEIVKPVILDKTSDCLDRNELVEIVKRDSRISTENDDVLRRLITRAINQLGIVMEERAVGKDIVKCVKKEDAINIENQVFSIIKNDKERLSVKTVENSVQKEVPVLKEQSIIKTEINPITVKKYIPISVWKQIEGLCGNNKSTLLNILNEINKLNMDITKQMFQGPVQYLTEDKVISVSKMIDKKSGCGLSQSIDANGSNDRKRIVWTMNSNEKIIVALGCFDEHQGSIRVFNQYDEALVSAAKCKFLGKKGRKVSLANMDLNRYYDVEELIKIYSTNSKTKDLLSRKISLDNSL